MISYPYSAPALRISQPMGDYFVSVLPARLLLDVAYSFTMVARLNDDGQGYTVDGTQRLKQPARLDQITDYIDRGDSAFPNSIILAANFDQETGFTEEEAAEIPDEDDPAAVERAAQKAQQVWTVSQGPDGCWRLNIPTKAKLAAIIDGQHRLFSFPNALPERLDMDLICAVFLDLPKPFQAQLFATINSTQKPVDKSLTYELFGYNISEETADHWTPDKLAVFLTRKLNTERDSPLRGKILVAPKRDEALFDLNANAGWTVSTAVVVEGIMRLFSSNPKRDTNEMLTPPVKARRALDDKFRDRSPLRSVYIQGNDALLYAAVLNYTKACDEVFWQKAKPGSFIVKTVGVQALFDILRQLAAEALGEKDFRQARFVERLAPAGGIDFTSAEYRSPSGSGRTTIRRAIAGAIGLQT